MKIAITGASGFIGQHLAHALKREGHSIIAITRKDFDLGTDHLAGAPINRHWSEACKQEIISSCVQTTKVLVDAMKQLDNHPEQFISTSAIGAFDDQGHYTESNEPNATDFLGEVSKQWEPEFCSNWFLEKVPR